MPIRIAIIELINNKRFAFLFLLNLMIGILGFVSLDGFKNGFQNQLESSSRKLQTADVSVSARRSLTDSEREILNKTSQGKAESSELVTVYSMVSAQNKTVLVELEAVDTKHPFYGWIKVRNQSGKEYKASTEELNGSKNIWVAPEVLTQFNVKIGSELKIGDASFTISAVIIDDTGMSWAGAAYAPRIYMGLNYLDDTGLVREASTAWRSFNFKITDNSSAKDFEKALSDQLDNSVRVKSFLKAGQDNGRLLGYLTDYLGLVSLVALFLSGLGSFYLFRTYLQGKQKEIAVLLSLGMPASKAISIYLYQLVFLGLLASLLSLLLSKLIISQGSLLLSTFSPVDLNIVIGTETIISALVIGVFTPVLLSLPLLLSVKTIKPAELFQEFYKSKIQLSPKLLLAFIPALMGSFALSILQSRSFLVGGIFFSAMLIASISILLIGNQLLIVAGKFKAKSLSSRLAISYLKGNRGSALSCFLALALSSLLMNLIPQLESTLLKELEQPSGEDLPSLFLFDIQEDQADKLKSLLTKQNLSLNFMAPMVQARLKLINDKEVEKVSQKESFSREAEREQRSRNRGVNLSYRPFLHKSESIVDGEAITGSYNFEGDKLPKLSIEERYAKRMDLKIGDKMTFDIQGLPIEGIVTNLRKVKWNTFQPNFFILFQPGVVDDAPKTFLAALPPMQEELKNRIQYEVVDSFPNISIIDVTKLVKKLSEVISQMSYVLKIMAWLSVLAGLIVILSIASHQVQQRSWDINLLKVLGAAISSVQASVLKEFALLSLFSGIIGSLGGLLASWLISRFVFDGLWSPGLWTPFISLIWTVTLCLFISWLASRNILRQKPRLYL